MNSTSFPSDQRGRSSSRSTSAEMSKSVKRSSKQLNAAALEADRKAKEQADRKNALDVQIAKLQAEVAEATENKKRNEEQAALDRQAAKDQQFHEAALENQEVFRMSMSQEVYVRVAQTLESVNDCNYMTAVAEGRSGFENPTEFKAMLWEAIAGDDLNFLRGAADSIAKHYNKVITDSDIDMIRKSTACLDPGAIQILPQNERLANDIVEESSLDYGEKTVSQKVDQNNHVITQPNIAPNLDASNVGVQPSSGLEMSEATTNAVTEFAPARNVADARSVKQESIQQALATQNAMDKIEKESVEQNKTEEPFAEEDIDAVQRSEALASTIDEDAPITHDQCGTSREAQVPLPATPDSTTGKRYFEDDEETTHTPNEVGTTSASKRRKTTGTKSNPAALKKLKNYLDARAQDGNFNDTDLACSKCENEAENPRMTAKCYHIYCFKCFNTLKGDAVATVAHKIKCCHQGCEKALGPMSMISIADINELREKYAEETEYETQESGTGDQGKPVVNLGIDEEMTDEE